MGSGLSNNRSKNTGSEPKNPPKKSNTTTETKDIKAVEQQADQVKQQQQPLTTEPPKTEKVTTTTKTEKKKSYVPEFVFHSDKDLLYGSDVALPWQESYALGFHIVDEQHKMLVKLINELAEAVKDGHMRYEIGSVFDNLVEYTDFHFKKEEEMMAKYNYVEEEEADHKEKHGQFIKKVLDLRQAFINMAVNNIGQDLLDFLTDWLLTHICQTDKKLCDFLMERNVVEE